MELLLWFFVCLFRIFNVILSPILAFFSGTRGPRIPEPTSIKSISLLKLPAVDLAQKIRMREVKAYEVVSVYIERIKQVNPIINAVVQDRFEEALDEAIKADSMVQSMTPVYLLQNYPLLGVPFTVKESCSLKGMLCTVGSMNRRKERADRDGVAVANLRSAGAIPLLVSSTSEYCTNLESYNNVNGITKNPFDSRRTAGGSSSGEGALIGAGASLFGVGSDFLGSIRIPAMYCGIFGHKPTGGIVSVDGHFPTSPDEGFRKMLVVGPMSRYAKDLPTLLHIMAGEEKAKALKLTEPLKTKDVKVYYLADYSWKLIMPNVNREVLLSIKRGVDHLRTNGVTVQEAPPIKFYHLLEATFSTMFSFREMPRFMKRYDNTKEEDDLWPEVVNWLFGKSKYSAGVIIFSLIKRLDGFMSRSHFPDNIKKAERIKKQIINLLGDDGVLLVPTWPTAAPRHYGTATNIQGFTYLMAANVCHFPSTHIPLGLDETGLPVGFQAIAAPNQDRLCLLIAAEMEAAFGGWVPPF